MSIFAAQYLVGPGVFVDVTDTAAFRTHLGLGSAALLSSDATVLVSPATATANTIQPANATSANLILKARAAQTANILELQASGGTLLLSAGTNGGVTISPPAHVPALTLDVPHTSTQPTLILHGSSTSNVLHVRDASDNTSIYFDAQNGLVAGKRFNSTIGNGTSPIVVSSTTACTSLNADMLDGSHAADIISAASGGATSATAFFPAHSFFLAGTNSAGLVSIGDGTTARVCLAFDDTTETYGHNIVTVPANLNASGTVSFSVFGGLRSSTTGNLLWTFGERESGDTESWTGAYADYDSASTAISGATTTQRAITWSVAVATLGWAAGDVIRFRVSRDPSVSGDATGDSLLDLFSITFPTA